MPLRQTLGDLPIQQPLIERPHGREHFANASAALRVSLEDFTLVPLTQNRFALVDANDLAVLAPYHWTAFRSSNTWYAKAHVGERIIYMHRLLLLGDAKEATDFKVDHISGNGLDNRRKNLRVVTHGQNMMNSVGRTAIRKSRYKGVSVRVHSIKPYRACIQVQGKQKHLGYFAVESDAARAYDEAARHYFGPHARTNFGGGLEVAA